MSFDNREEQLDRFEKRFEEVRLLVVLFITLANAVCDTKKLVQSLTALHTQEEAGYIRSLSRVSFRPRSPALLAPD